MLLVLSPSKTLDESSTLPEFKPTQPVMLAQAQELAVQLRGLSAEKLAGLMSISDKLAALNHARYRSFKTPFTPKNARPALFTFKGDVYEGMEVAHYSPEDLAFAQQHVRILSGLYGVLRPLDLMQPYRLEMGTALKNPRGKDLYAFWGDSIAQHLSTEAGGVLVNLASEEYFKAVRPQAFKGEIFHVQFKENHKGALKVIGIHAKRARGLMADFVIKHKIAKHSALREFGAEGYEFQPKLSGENIYVFVR